MFRAVPIAAAFALLGAQAQAADHTVEIHGMGFQPATVEIAVGDTVTFLNTNRAIHTATANDGSFDTGRLRHQASTTVTFGEAGAFPFECVVHPAMKGTIEVR